MGCVRSFCQGHGGRITAGGRLHTYNPVLEGHELLFLLLPALKVGFNESLQFIQVLLHALAVDVLHQTEAAVVAPMSEALQELLGTSQG